MLTDSYYAASKYSRSEGKPRYSSFITASSLTESRRSESKRKVQAFTLPQTPKKPDRIMDEQATLYEKPSPIKYKPVLNITNVVTLSLLFIILLMVFACHINLQFQSDSQCWEKFKQRNCDINNPQGNECLNLYHCISQPQFQVSLAWIISGVTSILLGVRFRRNLKVLLTRLLELWEALAWDKVQVEQ